MKYQLHLGDCLEFMKTLQPGSVDAVITDPPYGLGLRTVTGGTSKNSLTKFTADLQRTNWDAAAPSKEFFDQLLQIGKVQVIWGGNYFELPPTRCFLVWDKMTYIPSMSRVEIAWTSLDHPAKYIMINSNNPNREHPTQKPVELMRWCLGLFTQPGDVVFDPFMGSGTTGVACMQLGRQFIGCEIDPHYFEIAHRRIEAAAAQAPLFTDAPAKPAARQGGLL